MVRQLMTGLVVIFAAATSLALSGCYTRLTTPKETREWRVTYPELEENHPIVLEVAQGDKGNAFVMTADYYIQAVQRFAPNGYAGRDRGRFQIGWPVRVSLPDHPEDPINGTYIIRPDGCFDIGHIQDFPAANRTYSEVRQDLSLRLQAMFRGFPDPSKPPQVNVNIPVFENSVHGGVPFSGRAHIFNTGVGGGGGVGGSGIVNLTGDDTLLQVLAQSASSYSSKDDWREIAVFRRITGKRNVNGVERSFTYYVIIIVDLERGIYENPNLLVDIQNGDVVVVHPEKNPLIVEIVRSAQLVFSIWNDFTGVESVLQDIFKRDF